jgi:hypothetical protein
MWLLLGRVSAIKFATLSGASVIAMLAFVFEPPPFGNIWFDMLAGGAVLFLLQCFAYSLEKPHKESSDSYKSFYRFCHAAFGVGAWLSRNKIEFEAGD